MKIHPLILLKGVIIIATVAENMYREYLFGTPKRSSTVRGRQTKQYGDTREKSVWNADVVRPDERLSSFDYEEADVSKRGRGATRIRRGRGQR